MCPGFRGEHSLDDHFSALHRYTNSDHDDKHRTDRIMNEALQYNSLLG